MTNLAPDEMKKLILDICDICKKGNDSEKNIESAERQDYKPADWLIDKARSCNDTLIDNARNCLKRGVRRWSGKWPPSLCRP